MRTPVTLRQLEFLVALDDSRHFGRAAEAIHVTQSTLSAGLKELETTLGATLAERDRRHVAMTPLGAALAVRARSILRDVEGLVEQAATESDPLAGMLRLGAASTIGPYVFPALVGGLGARFPRLRLRLQEGLSDDLRAGLRDGGLDAAIVALPYDMGDAETRALIDDGYLLACPKDHPLANRDEIDGGDLTDRPLLLLERGHCLQRHALSAFGDEALRQDAAYEATSLPTLAAMVAARAGVTLLPEIAVRAGVAEGHDLALIPIRGAHPRRIALAWRRGAARSAAFEALASACAEILRAGQRP
ncbi:hydrogen peroxide-inducible genes activator [Rubrimonas cliftonensis]|uniref:LysR family transcriptional regulator, hydrogen peroxide-inducible genes activator n=1 Tax=Rubrimonas cliftonensis TaxID=89524 RepID=A0A1H3YHJ9_9RHOB|nr:hydrogen peroxide-inducible genes activator [Rubrimonas cliftonensis]SEA10342.1 LysR family transcriptional regulator, hydrogen peroxide-inducible genes activator [Rubrimonas cliftonensis]